MKWSAVIALRSRLLMLQSSALGKLLLEFKDFQRTVAVTNVKGDRRNAKRKSQRAAKP